jgi:hypothetical protein
MFKKLLVTALCIHFFFGLVQAPFAQEPEQESDVINEERGLIIEERGLIIENRGLIIEEEIEEEPREELRVEDLEPQFITADVLTQRDIEPAINFYIRSDINRKFSGLIANLRLEKTYGILQVDKKASVFFDYSYTSLRNPDKVLFEKGKMTFMKFNSGKWFNAELSIYLMDSYPFVTKK